MGRALNLSDFIYEAMVGNSWRKTEWYSLNFLISVHSYHQIEKFFIFHLFSYEVKITQVILYCFFWKPLVLVALNQIYGISLLMFLLILNIDSLSGNSWLK